MAGSYLRIEAGRAIPASQSVDVGDGLLFIDVASERAGGWEGEVADQLRFVDETIISGREHVVIRVPSGGDPAGLGLIRTAIERRTKSVPAIGQASFGVGNPRPRLEWLEGNAPAIAGSEILAAARSVELAAILQAGGAHWRPSTFHYELPSRQHRADFIRVGDGFRSPRDARALATWLYPYVDIGRAVLLDTSTLLPLVLALQDAAEQVGTPLGPVAVRDCYPDSRLSDDELIELTVGANGALALVSVSSTGDTVRSLAESLEQKGISASWIEVLVDRIISTATDLRQESDGQPLPGPSEPWLLIPDATSVDADECDFCLSPDRAPHVRIDPGSFANTLLPEPPTIAMPDPPSAARRIDRLLELYDDVDGIGIDCDPAERTKLRRSERRWAIRFYPHRLLGHPKFFASLDEQLSSPPGGVTDGRLDLPQLQGFDTIAYLDEDATDTADEFLKLLEWLPGRIGGTDHVNIVPIPARHEDASVQRNCMARDMFWWSPWGQSLEAPCMRCSCASIVRWLMHRRAPSKCPPSFFTRDLPRTGIGSPLEAPTAIGSWRPG